MIKIAIVGRPNVGKSALFNRICGKRIAIVDDAEGVTRDRLYAGAECFGRPFQVIDTGGIDAKSKIPFQEAVRRQAEIAMEEADSIIMVVDAVIGSTLLDEEVARILRRKNKPVCLAVNKVDDFSKLDLLHQFHSLGINRMVAVSATQGFQIAELLESALSDLPPVQEEEVSERIKVAIVGRPNVGKSTLMNYLLKEERCVVSPVAGTTRDSIDVPLGDDFLLIDTAGIRRKKAESDVVDKFAALRTERAISRADVCILVMDAQEGITVQEKRIADQIEQEGKGCLLLFNKWDLVKGFRMEHCLQGVHQEAPFLKHCPALFASAQTGRNLKNILSQVKEIHTQLHRRITTGQLNKFLEKALQKYHPPMLRGKRLRIYYIAQIDVAPPRFVMFVNYPELMLDTYNKYLVHQFREIYGFMGSPLVFALKGKRTKEERGAVAAPSGPTATENIWVAGDNEGDEEMDGEEWLEEEKEKELILEDELL